MPSKSRGTRDNAVQLRHVQPARVPLRHAAPSPTQVPDSLHRLEKAQSPTTGFISYLDTLIKTGSAGIETALRRRRILFAGFVARMEDMRLPKCVIFGKLVGGAGCVGGQEKVWMVCFLDLRAFGTNAGQWTTAAQDEGEWRRTAEQGSEHFTAKWIAAAEKARAGLRHAVVCPNVTEMTKEKIAQSKRLCAGLLALVD